MSQVTAQSAPNSGGSTYRANMNNIVGALFSNNSGPSAPTTAVGGQLWLDTGVSPPVMRQRNTANTAWIVATPEAVPAASVWGNYLGAAAPLGPVDMGTLKSLLDITAAGDSVITAADITAIQAVLNFPKSGAGGGQSIKIDPGIGNPVVMPAGGRWFYYFFLVLSNGTINTSGVSGVGVVTGGTTVSSGSPTNFYQGFCWRIG